MIVLLHVLIALTSITYATYVYFRPSKQRLYAGYGLVAATLLSGTYLALSTHAALLSACTSGLLYLAIVGALLFAAARQTADS